MSSLTIKLPWRPIAEMDDCQSTYALVCQDDEGMALRLWDTEQWMKFDRGQWVPIVDDDDCQKPTHWVDAWKILHPGEEE